MTPRRPLGPEDDSALSRFAFRVGFLAGAILTVYAAAAWARLV